MSSSKNFVTVTSSLNPFRLLVLIIKSRAKCGAGLGSNNLRVISLSRGSPGTICQWSKVCWQNAWPWVETLKSVSNPFESRAGSKALIVYNGEPGLGKS